MAEAPRCSEIRPRPRRGTGKRTYRDLPREVGGRVNGAVAEKSSLLCSYIYLFAVNMIEPLLFSLSQK